LVFPQVGQTWSAVGVTAVLQQLAFPEYLRRSAASDWEGFDLFASVWSHYQFGDVTDSLRRFSGLHPSPYFCAPELHDDIQLAEGEMDPATREQMLQSLMAQLHAKTPSVPLIQYAGINVTAPRVLTFKSKTDAILFGEIRVTPDD